MDAITLLKDDHKTVERLFKQFEKAGDNAYAEKRKVAGRICTELSIHAAIEEQLFYPVIRATVDGVEDLTLESLEEHHIVKWVLSEIDDMDPKDERFTAKMTVLMENIRHHVEEEEDDLFPKVRASLTRTDLAKLGDAMEKAKALAPTHPHPAFADTPPGNLVAGAAAAVVDRVTDTVKDAAGSAVSGAQDLITGILGSRNGSTPKTTAKRTAKKAASTSKSTAKKAASTTKSTAKKAAGSTKATARRAGGTAKKAAGVSKTTAKKAASTSKTAAKKTTSAAKRSAAARKTGGAAKKTAGVSRTTAKKAASTSKTAAKKTTSAAKRSAAARR